MSYPARAMIAVAEPRELAGSRADMRSANVTAILSQNRAQLSGELALE